MSIITQPPQATVTIIRPSGKKHLLAGNQEDIAWVTSLFVAAVKANKTVKRFAAKRILRIERREFDRLVEVLELYPEDK